MKPMQTPSRLSAFSFQNWWPPELGDASSSGSSSELRYAYFSRAQRLLIEHNGMLTTYDTGVYQFRGALRASGSERKLSFVSQHGLIALDALKVVAPVQP